jgi:hypothetical protein
MESTSTGPGGSSNSNPHRGEAGTGHFMLTLCRLAAPVSIRPPESPQLKPFTFFTSRVPQPDGSERLYLHMGYFETLAAAEKWVNAIRSRYPHAIATIAPGAAARPCGCEADAAQHENPAPGAPGKSAPAPARDESLTDTQVLRMLETRRASPRPGDADEHGDQVALLRPEDTATREALREAVAQGAPVSFAVQLEWSPQPIDASRVPSLALFKGHTLYAVESRREGRSRYFLRLGFFADPISAKQIAAQVRARFVSAAVVPVSEQEISQARAADSGAAAIPCLVQQRVEVDSNSAPRVAAESPPAADLPRRRPRGAATLEQTLKQLAERELWTDPDSLSESGVRHLRVVVQERSPRRS